MTKISNNSILLLGKKNDENCLKAIKHLKHHFSNVEVFLGEFGEKIPTSALAWKGDYIISYLSRWIISKQMISNAKKSSINFHPAPPSYPGTGCTNFALYEEAKYYGVTCHHMLPKVDTGPIISTKKFKILDSDNVETLLKKTYELQLKLFYEIIQIITDNNELPLSNETWSPHVRTRKELNDLSKISINMTNIEIKKKDKSNIL